MIIAVIGYKWVSAVVSAKEPLIVEVRTEDEFASGWIPGATNIPLSEVGYAFSRPEEKLTDKSESLNLPRIQASSLHTSLVEGLPR